MPKNVEIILLPNELDNLALLRRKAASQAGIPENKLTHVEVLKRSLDARSRTPLYRLKVDVYGLSEQFTPEEAILPQIKPVNSPKTVLIIGAGPAGYFAALELLELGIKPIVLDRGKDVRGRRRDLKAIQQDGIVGVHSNYCYGEGGAGTYSDGKLYTRSVKRGNVQKSLQLLVEHGATADILIDAHPHIGSNKLPEVVQNIRQTILNYGGEVHFNQFVTDFIVHNNVMKGVVTHTTDENPVSTEWLADAVILATGHSARDIYTLLHQKGILIEAKSFALGVRVEHPQALVDEVQYKQNPRDINLPASSYSLVCQVGNRGVFSFCMCPGGLVVPAATAPGEIVVNGMSMSRRDSPFANSGMVTAIEPDDLIPYRHHGVFAALEFQKSVEQALFKAGDGSQKGPALRLTDFINGRLSSSVPKSSYIPGLYPAPLFDILPDFIYQRLREGLSQFGKQMKGFYTEEANVIGTESRTSSPVRVPRDAVSLMHPVVQGFFPCGEGAGFAGGIISAAMDGQNVAKGVARFI
jgi:uncharacterized protein